MTARQSNKQPPSALNKLRNQYRDLTGLAAPRNLRAPLLKRLIGWHVHCIEKSVPNREAFFYRTELIKDVEPQFARGKTTYIEDHTVLIREHNGRTHIVRKGNDGEFRYAGRKYRSLTAVAYAITGVHQSGPRFFGIKSCKAQ